MIGVLAKSNDQSLQQFTLFAKPDKRRYALHTQALRKIDASSQEDAVEGVSGNGVAGAGENSTGKSQTGQTNRKQGPGVELVETLSAARIKQAENAEKQRKIDQAFVERYDARLKEVQRML